MPENIKMEVVIPSDDIVARMLADPVLLYVFRSQSEPPQVALSGSPPS